MPGSPTPNLGLIVPTIGGDNNLWGTELNENLATLDQLGTQPVETVNASAGISATLPETFVKATTGASNLTLTISAAVAGQVIAVKKMDSGAGWVVITPATGEIEGGATLALANQYQKVRVFWDGANWWAI